MPTLDQDRRWFKHYPSEVSPHLSYPEVPLHMLLRTSAERFPNRVALEFYGTEYTYAELYECTQRFAAALHKIGVVRGDRVALHLPNCPHFVIALYAISQLGAVAVNCSAFCTMPELSHQIRETESKVWITWDGFYRQCLSMGQNISGLVSHTIAADLSTDGIPKGVAEGALGFEDMVEHTLSIDMDVPFSMDDLLLLQHTAGTTGRPKAAMLSHRNLLSNVYMAAQWTPLLSQGQETFLCILPLSHIYSVTGCLNFGIYMGATLILRNRLTPKEILELIETYAPTVFFGVPTLYMALGALPEAMHCNFSSLKLCISGAAALPTEVAYRFEALAKTYLIEGYGLTEASPISHMNPLCTLNRKVGSIGLPLPGIDSRIVSEKRQFLSAGEVGELAISGPSVMQGYWKPSLEDEKCFFIDSEGTCWLLTGDLAYMDDLGYTYIVDRKKDVIISNGFTISPREVEEALYAHPCVLESAVIGVPDRQKGEGIKAYVVLSPTQRATEAELLGFLKLRLAKYKLPTAIEFIDELPKTFVGKVRKQSLRQRDHAAQGALPG